MPTHARIVALAFLTAALLAAGCTKSDPKTDASLAKLEADAAAQKAALTKVEEELKRSNATAAEQSAELKKVSENLTSLRIEFAKAAPGIVSLPPPKEERFEKLELHGSFGYAAGKEGVVGFGEMFVHPPSVELGSNSLVITECTTTGFKWKDTSKTEYTDSRNSVWRAKGVRRVLPGDAGRAEENAKYGKQIAEQFLKTFVALQWNDNRRFVTDEFVRSVGQPEIYHVSMPERYYGAKAAEIEAKRFKTFAFFATSISPDGKEVLCTGTLQGDNRVADFTLVLKPAPDASWRVNAFNLVDKPLEKK